MMKEIEIKCRRTRFIAAAIIMCLGAAVVQAGDTNVISGARDAENKDGLRSATLDGMGMAYNHDEPDRRHHRQDRYRFIPNRRGFYLGMGFGFTSVDTEWKDEDEEAAVRLFLGGRFSPFLSAELAWTFFDDDRDGRRYRDDWDDWDDCWDHWDPDFQASFYLIGMMPLDNVDLFGKFGIVHWFGDHYWNGDDCDDYWDHDDDDSDVGLGLGGGFLFHTSRHVGLKGEVEVSTLDDDDDNRVSVIFGIQFTF